MPKAAPNIPSIYRVATKKMEIPFLQGATWIRRGVTGTSYSWDILLGRKRNIFHKENNQPLEYSLQGSGGFPKLEHSFKIQLDRVLGRLV